MTPIRLVLVDDQHLFRSGLTVIIEAQPDMTVVGQAADGREALDVIAATDPDVVLMDVQMSPMDGVESTRRLLQTNPRPRRPRVIMLTTFELDPHAARAIRYGAAGFLLKVSTPQFVCETIRTVHSGGSVLASQDLTAILDQAPPTEPAPPEFARLTERERKVFDGAAEGLSNAEIAGRLFLSESTVKTHIGAILRKLDLRDRVNIVVYAYEHRLRR